MLGLLVHLSATAEIQFQVKFSRPYAVTVFIRNLSAQRGPNPFKKLFTDSKFNNERYKSLLASFDSIYVNYEHSFRDYPPFTKQGAETGSILNQHLINAQSLQDFKMRSIGLIPVDDLNKWVAIIQEFTPVYESLIYEPNKITFEKQVKDIEALLVLKNIAGYFDQAKQFYNASWDNSIPFVFTFYPLPNSVGFTAANFNNIAVSAIPASLTNYNALLSVLLHELSHFLYDAQPLSFKKEMDAWFTANPSKFSRYAYRLLDESWATAVGNGYFSEKLSGRLNPGNWYNQKYISRMGKLMYPLIKEYIDNKKPIDKTLVDRYIKIYEDSIPNSITELDYILESRYAISDDPSHFAALDSIYPTHIEGEYYRDFSAESFGKLKRMPVTKVIIVSGDNKKKLRLIRENFPELKNWQPNAKKDFIELQLVADKTQLVVINLVENALEQQLKLAASKSKPSKP